MKNKFTSLVILLYALGINANANDLKTGNPVSNYLKTSGITKINQFYKEDSPLFFLENRGQINDQYGNPRNDIDFKISGGGVQMFIGNGSIHYQWSELNTEIPEPASKVMSSQTSINTYRMDVTLVGCNPKATIIKEAQQPYKELHYDSKLGEKGVVALSYHKITYKNIYPYIDWVFYVNQKGQLEHDFVVHPGGKVSDIQMQYEGTTALKINNDGSLTAYTLMGEVKEAAPYCYTKDGKEVVSSFLLDKNTVTFRTTPHQGTLIIDPTLDWATYYGGSENELFSSIALDSFGNIYVYGAALSNSNIATTGSFQNTLTDGRWNSNILIKFNAKGEREWGTYYFRKYETYGYGDGSVTTDAFGNVYICGGTQSNDVATTGAHQVARPPGARGTPFLTKFGSNGERIWSTYYGGTRAGPSGPAYSEAAGTSIVCDHLGNVYMAGVTIADDSISTSGSHQTIRGNTGVYKDAFLVKFDSSGLRLWGTYYGGEEDDYASSVVCDGAGDVYLCGWSRSPDNIATAGSYQPTHPGGIGGYGISSYLVKFNSSGTRLWGTYYGTNDCEGSAIYCDKNRNIYMTGSAYYFSSPAGDTSLSTTGSFQFIHAGRRDAFLAKFDSLGNRVWGTFYGGTLDDYGIDVTGDHLGNIYIAGATGSVDGIATLGAYQEKFGGGQSYGDAFWARFDSSGKRLYATYYGGEGVDMIWHDKGIVTDQLGNVYISGATLSDTGIATPGSFSPARGGGRDGFLAKFIPDCSNFSFANIAFEGDANICEGDSVVLYLNSGNAFQWQKNGVGISETNDSFLTVKENGSYSVKILSITDVGDICSYNSDTVIINVNPLPDPQITSNGNLLSTDPYFESYQWYKNDTALINEKSFSLVINESGYYTVEVTDTNGCKGISDVYNGSVTTRNIDFEKSVIIYPNPATNTVYIRSDIPVRFSLIDVEGRSVIDLTERQILDISNLVDGVYFIKIFSNEKLLKIEKLLIYR